MSFNMFRYFDIPKPLVAFLPWFFPIYTKVMFMDFMGINLGAPCRAVAPMAFVHGDGRKAMLDLILGAEVYHIEFIETSLIITERTTSKFPLGRFCIAAGSVLMRATLIGPNGAEKSTLTSILAILTLPNRGTAKISNLDVVSEVVISKKETNPVN